MWKGRFDNYRFQNSDGSYRGLFSLPESSNSLTKEDYKKLQAIVSFWNKDQMKALLKSVRFNDKEGNDCPMVDERGLIAFEKRFKALKAFFKGPFNSKKKISLRDFAHKMHPEVKRIKTKAVKKPVRFF